ncbi:MAG TPA: hypothetical protein VF221_04400 [Chloroflexota bacterium]
MDVRLARPTDAPLVLSLALDTNAHAVKSYGWPATNHVARTLMRATMPLALRGRMWIAREDDGVALLEAEPRQFVIGWDVMRLVARGRQVDPPIAAVLQAAISHLHSRGVPRLFARCSEDDACCHLRPLGFHGLAREYVLLGPEKDTARDVPPPLDSRYRMPQDDWPLHQLESQVTPALVRQLEGLTSLDWSRPARRMSEIVVERDGKVVAWIGWGTHLGNEYRGIAALIHPDYMDLAPDLVAHAMTQVGDRCRLVARVRDYHVQTLRVFTDAGFTVVAEELLLVKHGRVELAPVQKARLAVHAVPSIQGFHVRLSPSPLPSFDPQKDAQT